MVYYMLYIIWAVILCSMNHSIYYFYCLRIEFFVVKFVWTRRDIILSQRRLNKSQNSIYVFFPLECCTVTKSKICPVACSTVWLRCNYCKYKKKKKFDNNKIWNIYYYTFVFLLLLFSFFFFSRLLNANEISCIRRDAFRDLHNVNLLWV